MPFSSKIGQSAKHAKESPLVVLLYMWTKIICQCYLNRLTRFRILWLLLECEDKRWLGSTWNDEISSNGKNIEVISSILSTSLDFSSRSYHEFLIFKIDVVYVSHFAILLTFNVKFFLLLEFLASWNWIIVVDLDSENIRLVSRATTWNQIRA